MILQIKGVTINSTTGIGYIPIGKGEQGTVMITCQCELVRESPVRKTIASASEDKTVKLWSIEGTQLHTFKGHSGAVTSVSFSPDGKTIASASSDGSVKLWSMSIEGEQLHTLKGHSGSVTSVSFSPDGKTIASASSNGTIILWNFDLEDLLVRGCDWLRDQKIKTNVSESGKGLCKHIGTQK